MDDLDDKAVNLTNFIFTVPTYRRILLYLLAISFTGGVAKYFFENAKTDVFNALLLGGADGVLLFGLPALVAALLATSILSRSAIRQSVKYFLFIALLSTALYVFMYLLSLAVDATKLALVLDLQLWIVIANALVLVVWFVSLLVPLNYKFSRALLIAFLHPLLNLSFIVIAQAYASFEKLPSLSFLLAVKFFVASAILLVSLGAIFAIVNAPAKRNFGISTVQVATFFFAQWIRGGKGLEEVLSEVGTMVETQIGSVVFKTGKKIKACFLVPSVHFGPFGNLGGSEFPFLLSNCLEKRFNAPMLVFHGLANHDFNPVFSSSYRHLCDEYEKQIKKTQDFQSKAAFTHAKNKDSDVFGITLEKNNSAFLTLSRAPKSTEDIEVSLGLALQNKAKSKGFKKAILADRHNSKGYAGGHVEAGSPEFYEHYDALDNLKTTEKEPLSIGVAEQKEVKGISLEHGVGKAGVKVAVIKTGKKTACFVLIDANNTHPNFRSHLLESLSKYSFNFADVFTTDTHAVNSISGIHNPLGTRLKPKDLAPTIKKLVDNALSNMQKSTASISTSRVRLRVLGEKRSSEMLSTVSAIVSVIKLLAPAIFIASILIAATIIIFLGQVLT